MLIPITIRFWSLCHTFDFNSFLTRADSKLRVDSSKKRVRIKLKAWAQVANVR
jgi:hypothetical protein